jgi:hypothetical protein
MREFRPGDRVIIVKEYPLDVLQCSHRDGMSAIFTGYVDNLQYKYSVRITYDLLDYKQMHEVMVHSIVHCKEVIRENKLKELLDGRI